MGGCTGGCKGACSSGCSACRFRRSSTLCAALLQAGAVLPTPALQSRCQRCQGGPQRALWRSRTPLQRLHLRPGTAQQPHLCQCPRKGHSKAQRPPCAAAAHQHTLNAGQGAWGPCQGPQRCSIQGSVPQALQRCGSGRGRGSLAKEQHPAAKAHGAAPMPGLLRWAGRWERRLGQSSSSHSASASKEGR